MTPPFSPKHGVAPRPRNRGSNVANGVYTMLDLAKLLELPQYDDEVYSDTYGIVHKAAIEAGESEEQAERAAVDAESEEEGERWSQYKDAVLHVAEQLCIEHKLTLHEMNGHRWQFRPSESWEKAASEVVKTINGYGMFVFSSVKEFMSSGPYTAREAVLGHLHWMHEWYNVYEGSSSKAAFYRRLR